jgi:predicted dehydrogenase
MIRVTDRDPDRAERLSRFHHVRRFASLDDLLGDNRVQLVLNLTNPSSHFAVSKACLEAGKHVYSERHSQ